MSRKMIPTIVLEDFSKGEASVFPTYKFKKGFSVKLQNCHISENGGISKNPGYTKVNSAAETGKTFKGGFEYRRTDGTVERVVAGGGKVYKEVGGTLTELQTIGAADFTCDANAVVSFAQLNNNLVMANGVDPPWYYDGANCDSYANHGSADVPPATTDRVHAHAGRIWFIEKTEMIATSSDLNDATEVSVEGVPANGSGRLEFAFILKTGDDLIEMATYVDLMVFYFSNHILIYSGSTLSGSPDVVRVQQITGTGVAGINCIQDVGTDQVFLSAKGLKSLKQVVTTGSLNMDDVSEFIDPTFMSAINSASTFASAHWPQRSWLLFMLDSVVYVYSYAWKAWGRITGADVKGMFNAVDGTLYFCGTTFIYKYGTVGAWDWAGTAFEWRWETAWVTASKGGRDVYPKLAQIFMEPGGKVSLSCDVVYDKKPVHVDDILQFTSAEDVDLMDVDDRTDVWDGVCSGAAGGPHSARDQCEADGGTWAISSDPFYMDGTLDVERVPMFGGGKAFQLKFSETSSVGPVEISKILIDAEVQK